MKQPLWAPSEDKIKNSNMMGFIRFAEKKLDRTLSDEMDHSNTYNLLHKWSINSPTEFWEIFLEFSNIVHTKNGNNITLDTLKIPGAKWFSGVTLNYAVNLFANNLNHDLDDIAILYQIENDASSRGEISFRELRSLVIRCGCALKGLGVKKGDKVAGYVANVPEAIVASIGAASIGAIWSSASPDFGFEALNDRFKQVEPNVVFASTHYKYNGKFYHTDSVVKRLKESIPSIEKIISIPYLVGDTGELSGDMWWSDFLPGEPCEIDFEEMEFNHPLFIMFSSGTTGAPKCIVHGTGGTVIQQKKELQLHSNINARDRLLFYTTCGWMMWNWQMCALSLGATICLYDGNPGYPDLSSMWQTVNDLEITHFGTSGRFIESCMKNKSEITADKLEKLNTILYTGSGLSESGYTWIYEKIKSDVHLAGISGGTDIISCFILGNPLLPVYAGEIQCKGLGVDVSVFNQDGQPALDEPGELVCTKPIPSMPLGFLNDPTGDKYRKAYFDDFPGVWCHGDYVRFTKNGGIVMYGRSDATLNPGGVRIGSAEIYGALDSLDFITGAIVVGWIPPKREDEVIVLFVVSPENIGDILRGTIKNTIKEQCSPRHVPSHIFQMSQLPVTRSGKTVELSVKAILAGKTLSNKNAIANPHVLSEIEDFKEKLKILYEKEI